MAITTCQQAVKLFPPTWQRHHLMIASTVVPIPIWLQSQMSLTAGQHGKAYQKRDASLLRCTLRSQQQLARPSLGRLGTSAVDVIMCLMRLHGSWKQEAGDEQPRQNARMVPSHQEGMD